jgi:hypothetical protein
MRYLWPDRQCRLISADRSRRGHLRQNISPIKINLNADNRNETHRSSQSMLQKRLCNHASNDIWDTSLHRQLIATIVEYMKENRIATKPKEKTKKRLKINKRISWLRAIGIRKSPDLLWIKLWSLGRCYAVIDKQTGIGLVGMLLSSTRTSDQGLLQIRSPPARISSRNDNAYSALVSILKLKCSVKRKETPAVSSLVTCRPGRASLGRTGPERLSSRCWSM